MLLDGKQIRYNSIDLSSKAKVGPEVIINLQGAKIQEIANPINAKDAATKEYVDALSSSSDYCNSVDYVTASPTSAIPVSYKGNRVLSTNPGTPGIFEWNASQARWVRTSDWNYVTENGGATLVPCKDTKTIFIAQAIDSTHATFTEIPQEQVTYTFGYGLKTSEDNDRILVQIDSNIVPSPEVIAALRNAINAKQNKLTSANAGTALDFTDNKFNFRPAGDGYYIDTNNQYVLRHANENQSGILSASDYRAIREARRQNQASWEENDPSSSMYVQGRTHYYIPTVVFDTPVVVPTSSNVDLELLEHKAEIGDRLKLLTNEYGSIYGNIEADGTVTFEPTGSLIKGELLGSPDVLQIQNYGYVDLNIVEAYNMTKYSAVKKIDDVFLPAYEIQQVEPTSPESSRAYALLKDGEEQGVKIEIPKDQVIEDAGSSVTTQEDIDEGGIFGPGTEYEGKFSVGDIYLWFEIYVGGSPSDKIIYVNVNKLVDIYVGDNDTILIEPVGSGSSMQISVIAEGVQGDWEENDTSSTHYIKNKPDIPTHTSDLINDGEGGSPASRFVTEDEIAQSDWEEDDTTDPAHVLNRPAIRKGTGTNSIVEGKIDTNVACDEYSHAEGKNTLASGVASHAEGTGSTSEANFTYMNSNHGQRFRIDGDYRKYKNSYIKYNDEYYEIKDFAYVSGVNDYSVFVFDESFINYDFTGEFVSGQAAGDYSHSEGWRTLASGNNSHAEGASTSASGTSSHAEGSTSIATGDVSHAEGVGTKASGSYSHSEGWNTVAAGLASHAEGVGTNASNYSHAEGWDTQAVGTASHAEGKGTNSKNFQHVSGTYNIIDNIDEWVANTQYYVGDYVTYGGEVYICLENNNFSIFRYDKWEKTNGKTRYAEIIGNGTGDSARSNARTLDWQGNETLAGNLTVNGTTLTVNGQQIDPQVQSDWDQTTTTAKDYIKNKPENLSDFNNDEGFIDNTVNNLTNYYDKGQVDQMISAISSLKIQVVDVLPTEDIDTSTIYLVPMAGSPSEDNVYEEYIYIIDEEGSPIVGHWEMIGTAQVDLTDYMQKSNNLNDVADRQTALNNLTGAGVDQAGKYLKVDNNGNIAFGSVEIDEPLTSQEIDSILV